MYAQELLPNVTSVGLYFRSYVDPDKESALLAGGMFVMLLAVVHLVMYLKTH